MDKCVINPERDCLGSAKAALLEKRIEDLEAWRGESKKFHNAFYDWQREQIARDARLDVKLQGIDDNLSKLVSWQEEQQQKPVRRWDGLVDKAVWEVLAAVIDFLLGRVGL